jgi:hypothetical protein
MFNTTAKNPLEAETVGQRRERKARESESSTQSSQSSLSVKESKSSKSSKFSFGGLGKSSKISPIIPDAPLQIMVTQSLDVAAVELPDSQGPLLPKSYFPWSCEPSRPYTEFSASASVCKPRGTSDPQAVCKLLLTI